MQYLFSRLGCWVGLPVERKIINVCLMCLKYRMGYMNKIIIIAI